jgi:lipoyl(octanoyl) transferase
MMSAPVCLKQILSHKEKTCSKVKTCLMLDLGRKEYEQSLVVQNLVAEWRKKKRIPDCLIFVEYPHLITLGRSGSIQHLLADRSMLEKHGVGFFLANRGGDITYHGPGQFIAYPVMDLKEWQPDVGRYLRSLEHCIINTLADFGVLADSIPELTGVWVGDKKIASIGIRTSQWVTSHGLALNVSPDLSYFDFIVPCGLRSKGVTSMMEILGAVVDTSEIKRRFCVHFSQIFERDLAPWRAVSIDWQTSGCFA